LSRVVLGGIGVFPRVEGFRNVDDFPSILEHVAVNSLENLDVCGGGFVLEHDKSGALGATEPLSHGTSDAIDGVLGVGADSPVGGILVPDHGGQTKDFLGDHSNSVVGL
jgi:hypothetical protein